MAATMPNLGKIQGETRGTTLAEYVILVGLVGVVCLGGFRAFGSVAGATLLRDAMCLEAMGCDQASPPSGEANAAHGLAPGVAPALGGPTGAGTVTGITPSTAHDVPQELIDLGRDSPTLRHAIDVVAKYGVVVQTNSGSEASYNHNANTITLGTSHSDTLLHEFVHEANHAETANSHPIDPLQLSRADYIHQKIVDEAKGEANAVQVIVELDRVNPPSFREMNMREAAEQAAWADGVAKARKDNPQASTTELDAAGRSAVQAWVTHAIETGQFTTVSLHSVNGVMKPEGTVGADDSYQVSYGKWWDRLHEPAPQPKPAAQPPPKPWWRPW